MEQPVTISEVELAESEMLTCIRSVIQQKLTAVTAERDVAIESIKQYSIREGELIRRAAVAETRNMDAEKQEPIWYLHLPTGIPVNSNLDEFKPEDLLPLYAAPIPSPDTADLIRKAREEEREACAKVCDGEESIERIEGAHEEYIIGRQMGSQVCASLIRARSTKEK